MCIICYQFLLPKSVAWSNGIIWWLILFCLPPDFGVGSDDDDNQSEESETEEKQIDKYRKLLQNIQETEEEKERKDVEMEVTWEPGQTAINHDKNKNKGRAKNVIVDSSL